MIIPVHSKLASRAYYEANWDVTDWYVDNDAGSDSNAGTSAGAPIKTLEELSARLAVPLPLTHPVTVHVAYSATSYGSLCVTVHQATAGAYFDVVGTPVLTSIGTITSYADRVAASNYEPRLVASGVSDWTSYVGKRIDVTDGASAGAICWVGKVSPQSVGVGTAGVTKFSVPSTAGYPSFSPTAVTPANGSAVSVAALPTVRLLSIVAQAVSPGGVTNTAYWESRAYSVKHLAIGEYRCAFVAGIVDGCLLETVRAKHYDGSTGGSITRCRLTGRRFSGANVFEGGGGFYEFCLLSPGTYNFHTVSLFYSLAYNATVNFCQGGFSYDCGFFDKSGAAPVNIPTQYAGTVALGGMYGNGNDRGLDIPKMGDAYVIATNYITGTSGSFRVNATYLPWTALPWLDGQRSGEATLVGGTVDVTVPYVLSTQTMRASHKTIGGTPGFLTCTYVDATHIRITSSSATDTSVASWYVDPVGDACVIRS